MEKQTINTNDLINNLKNEGFNVKLSTDNNLKFILVTKDKEKIKIQIEKDCYIIKGIEYKTWHKIIKKIQVEFIKNKSYYNKVKNHLKEFAKKRKYTSIFVSRLNGLSNSFYSVFTLYDNNTITIKFNKEKNKTTILNMDIKINNEKMFDKILKELNFIRYAIKTRLK